MFTKEELTEKRGEVMREILEEARPSLIERLKGIDLLLKSLNGNGRKRSGKTVAQHADDIVEFVNRNPERSFTGYQLHRGMDIPDSSARAAIDLLREEKPRRVKIGKAKGKLVVTAK